MHRWGRLLLLHLAAAALVVGAAPIAAAQSTSGPQVETESEPQAGTESEPQVGTESKPQVGTESGPQVGTESKPQVGTESEAESEPQAGTESKPQAGTESEPQVGTESEPQVGVESEPQAGTESEPQAGTEKGAAPARGGRLAMALPEPLEGQSARERIEDNAETGQVRVQRVYQDGEGEPVIAIVVRSETPETLKKREATFMDPEVVQAREGEFREIAGQRFAIMQVQGEYTAIAIVDGRYSVLFFGTADRAVLFAHIVSTDFSRIAAVR